MNDRIIPALAGTTGESYETPKKWWDWWRKQNEYYAGEHPVEQYYFSIVATMFTDFLQSRCIARPPAASLDPALIHSRAS